MKVRPIPPAVLNAVAGLLCDYAEGATPTVIVKALAQYDATGAGTKRSPADRRAVSVREYSSAWGISPDTTRRLIKAGRLQTVRVGVQHRIPIEELPCSASPTPTETTKS